MVEYNPLRFYRRDRRARRKLDFDSAFSALSAVKEKMSATHTARLHARVFGLVQGVYFRDSTRQKAESLRIVGWARNARDGSVEVMAEGPRSDLESLLSFLRVGPPSARVERVETAWAEATGEFTAFDIRT